MKLNALIHKIGGTARALAGRQTDALTSPTLGEAMRVGYGPFRFKTGLPQGTEYVVQASTDVRTWADIAKTAACEETDEYVDSEAFKYPYRFYRLAVGNVHSLNIIGYASVTLAPGFSMIANPFDTRHTVSDTFKDWPDGTTLNRFDTSLFRLTENVIHFGKWSNPAERLVPGEGAIFFNPTSDYKSVSFVGDVMQGHWSVPVPSGFSIRSSLVPQPGDLAEDLGFPIADGDVIHLFDRERQRYVLHPYAGGRWTNGAPLLSVGESFWVAKTEPGNWTQHFMADTGPAA